MAGGGALSGHDPLNSPLRDWKLCDRQACQTASCRAFLGSFNRALSCGPSSRDISRPFVHFVLSSLPTFPLWQKYKYRENTPCKSWVVRIDMSFCATLIVCGCSVGLNSKAWLHLKWSFKKCVTDLIPQITWRILWYFPIVIKWYSNQGHVRDIFVVAKNSFSSRQIIPSLTLCPSSSYLTWAANHDPLFD